MASAASPRLASALLPAPKATPNNRTSPRPRIHPHLCLSRQSTRRTRKEGCRVVMRDVREGCIPYLWACNACNNLAGDANDPRSRRRPRSRSYTTNSTPPPPSSAIISSLRLFVDDTTMLQSSTKIRRNARRVVCSYVGGALFTGSIKKSEC